MDDKVKTTVEKIVKLAQNDESFAVELRRGLENIFPATSVADNNIKKDIKAIREALEIRADVSISYKFIQDRRLRDQLIIDNLRMENVLLDTRINPTDRFVDFCVNAFYQIENIINYYFSKTYPQQSLMLKVLEESTAENGEYAFNPTKLPNLQYIPLIFKSNAFFNLLLPGDNFLYTVTNLRQIRNRKLHRSSFNEKFNEGDFSDFFKFQNFNSIRDGLIRMVNVVKEQDGHYFCEAEVKSLLPGACLLSFDGYVLDISGASYQNLKNAGVSKGNMLRLHMCHKDVVDFKFIKS